MRKYSTMLLAGALSICTVAGTSSMFGNIPSKVYAQEEVTEASTTKSATTAPTSEEQTATATTTEKQTETTTTATEAKTESTTEKKTETTSSTSKKDTTTEKDTTTKKDTTTEKDNRIEEKNEVKELQKDDSLKEEKVVSNIIPKVYNDTRLSMRNQKEYIGKFIYFNQTDSAWNQNGYCISSAGCGPTAMAVCISTLTGQWVTPLDTTIWAYNNGYYSNAGSSHDMIPALAKHYNLNCQGLGTDYEGIRSALKAGKPVVALMGPGYFTRGGHFIVLVGIDDQDQVTVADVASRERSSYKYALKDVIGQSKSASAGGPFWAISGKSKAVQKKEAQVKKQKKVNKQFEYRCKDIKSVLNSGYDIAVPMKQGTVSKTAQLITLTGIDKANNVSIQDQDKTVKLETLVKELNQDAITSTFWQMVHPMNKSLSPTMSDYLVK